MKVTVNYKDKRMPCQGMRGVVVCCGIGPGPKNVKVRIALFYYPAITHLYEIIPRGNLVLDNAHKGGIIGP